MRFPIHWLCQQRRRLVLVFFEDMGHNVQGHRASAYLSCQQVWMACRVLENVLPLLLDPDPFCCIHWCLVT